MDNKGFTLIELLATVVVLGLVMGITAHSVLGVIEKSKDKSEKIFVDKLENSIDAYISDARTKNELKIDSSFDPIDYQKCKLYDNNDTCIKGGSYNSPVYKMNSFSLSKISDSNLIQNKDIINPKNKIKCELNDVNVSLYRDSDMVYYYYADLSNLKCDVSEKYQIITNMPTALQNVTVINNSDTSGSNNGSTDASGSNNGSTDASGSNNGSTDTSGSNNSGTDASGSNNGNLTNVQNALSGKYYKKSSEIVLVINDVTSINGNEITTNVTKYKINFTQEVSKKISSSDKVIIAENKQTKKFCDRYEYNSNFQYYQLSRCNNRTFGNRKNDIYKLRTMLKDKYYCSDDTNSSKCRNFYKINGISYKNGKYYITSGVNYYLKSSVTSSLLSNQIFSLPITYYDKCSISSSDYSAEYTCYNQNKYSNN